MVTTNTAVKAFMREHYRHFNAKTCVEAAEGYCEQLSSGNKMLITLAGAMSTAEIGRSLAEMIRQDKVHAICCTGANLEEDLFNLVAHESYEHIPNWRALSAQDEMALLEKGLNRVTDTCIPEEEAMRAIEHVILNRWMAADKAGTSYFPHEFMYQMLLSGELENAYQIDPKNSWLLAAAQKNLPIFTPGAEDATLGNIFVSNYIKGNIKSLDTMKSGFHQMNYLVHWYQEITQHNSLGFFQIGGGIAGDFPICVVPLISQDLQKPAKLWSYFCQISDSTTSYGSYSGATPNEKITWGKLNADSPKFIIESDATIVTPLIFAYVLG
ncbi:MAG: deoxyhypusine synthase family protein [Deltaproteobacteria bacterium]|nr:deoxyhypusine synthase family protein [Deltaproteobacteria bacterium]